MITEDEWKALKESERYGMMANLFKRIEHAEQKIEQVEQKMKDLGELLMNI